MPYQQYSKNKTKQSLSTFRGAIRHFVVGCPRRVTYRWKGHDIMRHLHNYAAMHSGQK